MNWVKTNGKTNEEMTAAAVFRPRRDSRLSAVAAGPLATADGTGLLGITSEPFLSPPIVLIDAGAGDSRFGRRSALSIGSLGLIPQAEPTRILRRAPTRRVAVAM